MKNLVSLGYNYLWIFFFFFFFAVPSGILVLQPGIEPWPPKGGPEVLTTGLPRKSLFFKFLSHQIKAFLNYFADKAPSSQGYGFSCGHVWMWELDCEEGRVPKNWCFWTVVLEKTLESLGLQGDPTSPFWRRSALGFLLKEWC